MDLGLSNAGVQINQSLELDRTSCDTLQSNFNHKIRQMDIKDITVKEQLNSDILVGTYPCTKYSRIGNIHDNRSTVKFRTGDDLFLHFFRHIAISEPEMYIVENVIGMRQFPVVMEAMKELPNYYVNVLCPIDALTWLPQRRPRLILIGTRKPFTIDQPTNTTRITLKELLEPEPDIQSIPDYVHARLNGEYRDRPIICDPDDPTSHTGTLLANYGKDKSYQLVKDIRFPQGVRYYTPREYARLQGFPDWFQFKGSNTEIYKQIGNAVAVPVAQWIGLQALKYFNQ